MKTNESFEKLKYIFDHWDNNLGNLEKEIITLLIETQIESYKQGLIDGQIAAINVKNHD